MVARTIGGLCGGSISVAYAFLSDVTIKDERTRVMDLAGASIGLAFTIGPPLGAILAPSGFAVVRFDFGPTPMGWLLGLNGLVLVLVQGGLVGPISKRFGDAALAAC